MQLTWYLNLLNTVLMIAGLASLIVGGRMAKGSVDSILAVWTSKRSIDGLGIAKTDREGELNWIPLDIMGKMMLFISLVLGMALGLTIVAIGGNVVYMAISGHVIMQ